MAVIAYPSTSAYAATPQTSFGMGFYVRRKIPAASDDTTITLSAAYQYRPDKLAYDLYGNPSYWWIFAARNINLIRDPIYDFVAGLQIVVPSSATLIAALGVSS
jgi:hypothetical protein